MLPSARSHAAPSAAFLPHHQQHQPFGARQLATRAKGRGSTLQEAPPEPASLRLLDTELHVEAETSYIAVRCSCEYACCFWEPTSD